MLQILTHDILPVFFMLALGYGMGLLGKASPDEARAANRIGFMVMQPALIFSLIAGVDLSAFRLDALAVYIGAQVATFLIAYFAARKVFGREHLEAFLLAMATVFVNSLLYIWPIANLIYGPDAALPITAIVAWDASFSFAFFIVSMELMAGDRAGGGAGRRIVSNPVLLAMVLGAAMNASGLPVPEPVVTAAHFAGAAAAPLILFALGVTLSASPVQPNPVIAGIAGLKLLLFPAVVWAGMALLTPGHAWSQLFLMNAAGPSGAMAFSLALLYKVRTDTIAPVIIWTSALSLFSLSVLA